MQTHDQMGHFNVGPPNTKIRSLLKPMDRFYLLLVEFVYFEQLEAYINEIIGISHQF